MSIKSQAKRPTQTTQAVATFVAILVVLNLSGSALGQAARSLARESPRLKEVIKLDNALLDRIFGGDEKTKSRTQSQTDQASTNPYESAQKRNSVSINPNPGTLKLRPHRSFVAAIIRTTPARRATALRFAEKGRQSLAQGRHQVGIAYLEKALGLDSQPYFHFYLATAHFSLGEYEQSLSFLEIAASQLGDQREWGAEIKALAGRLSTQRRNAGKVAARDAESRATFTAAEANAQRTSYTTK